MSVISVEFERLLSGFLADALEGAELDRFLELVNDPSYPERQERLNALLYTGRVLDECSGRTATPEHKQADRRRSGRWLPGLLAACMSGTFLVSMLQLNGPDETSGRTRGGHLTAQSMRDVSPVPGLAYSILHADGTRQPRGLTGAVLHETDVIFPLMTCQNACVLAMVRVDSVGAISWLELAPKRSMATLKQGESLEGIPMPLAGLTGHQQLLLLAWTAGAVPDPEALRALNTRQALEDILPAASTDSLVFDVQPQADSAHPME